MGRIKQVLPFTILPFFLLITCIIMIEARGPFFLGLNLDPDYSYLLNALNIAEGEHPGHFHHPGTTLQLLGGMVIVITHWLSGTFSSIPEDLFANPEMYLGAICRTLLLLHLIVLFFVGRAFATLTGSLYAGLFFQLTSFIASEALNNFIRVTPETLLYPVVMLFCLQLLLILFKAPNNKRILLTGVLTGFACITKITFLPFVIIPFFLLKTTKERVLLLSSTLVTAAVLFMPAMIHYESFFIWLKKLLLHAGIHGKGPETIVYGSNIFHNLIKAGTTNPAFIILLIALSVTGITFYSLYRNRLSPEDKPKAKTMLTSIIALLLFTLLTLKHFGKHYYVPYYPLLIFASFLFGRLFLPPANLFFLKKNKLVIIGVALVLFLLGKTHLYDQLTHWRDQQLTIHEKVRSAYPEYFKVYYYRCSSIPFALGYGIARSFHVNRDKYYRVFRKIYPGAIIYNKDGRYFEFPEKMNFTKLQQMDKPVIWQGTPFSEKSKPAIPLKAIAENELEAIYLTKRKP